MKYLFVIVLALISFTLHSQSDLFNDGNVRFYIEPYYSTEVVYCQSLESYNTMVFVTIQGIGSQQKKLNPFGVASVANAEWGADRIVTFSFYRRNDNNSTKAQLLEFICSGQFLIPLN